MKIDFPMMRDQFQSDRAYARYRRNCREATARVELGLLYARARAAGVKKPEFLRTMLDYAARLA